MNRCLSVRLAQPQDAVLLQEMFQRCSPRTAYLRFHSPAPALPSGYVADCVNPSHDKQLAYVAELVTDAGRRVVGLGSAAAVPWSSGTRELGVVIEDVWQQQGIGDALVRELYRHAHRLGDTVIRVQACTSANPWMPARLARVSQVTGMTRSGCDVSIDTDVAQTLRRATWQEVAA